MALAAALALPLSLAGCGSDEPEATAAKAPAGPRLTLAPSDTVDWQDVSAEIATVDQAQVLARIPGILTTLTVKEGDMVSRGQAIGRIVDSQLGYQSSCNCGCFPRTLVEAHTSGCRILKEGSSHEALCRIGLVDGIHAGLHR